MSSSISANLSMRLYQLAREGTLGVPHSLGIHIFAALINIIGKDSKKDIELVVKGVLSRHELLLFGTLVQKDPMSGQFHQM